MEFYPFSEPAKTSLLVCCFTRLLLLFSRLVSLKRGLRKVRSQNYILLLPSTDAAYWTSKIPCDLMSLDQFMMVTNYMFALPRGSHLTDRISAALLQLQEEGILQRLFHKWWNSEECVGFTDSGYHYEMEGNHTRNTEQSGAFVSVRKPTTEMPPETQHRHTNGPTSVPEGSYYAQISNIPPIGESYTQLPTSHSKDSDSVLLSTLSTTISSQNSPSQNGVDRLAVTAGSTNTTNRRRHNNGGHSNRRHPRPDAPITGTTPQYAPWDFDRNPDRIPDYVEGLDPAMVNIPHPLPNPYGDPNVTEQTPVRYTFRPITYTVPTTLATTQGGRQGRNKNRAHKNEDNLVEDTYSVVGSASKNGFATLRDTALLLFFATYLSSLL